MTDYNVAELAQTLFEEAGDALFLFDPDSEQMLDVNPMAQRLTGYPRQELLKAQATYLFRSEAQGGMQRLRQAFRKTGLFHSQEGFLLRTACEGVWVPVNLTITRLHAEPKTLGLITARDVTAQRQAQLALHESRALVQRQLAQLEDIYRHTPVGLAFLDRDLRYVRINDWLALINGRPAAEHTGRRLHEVLPPAVADELEALARPVVEQGVAVQNRVYRRAVPNDPDDVRDWMLSLFPNRLSDGGVSGVYCVVADVTERRCGEDALRSSELRYRRLFERNLAGVFRSTAEGRLLDCNNSFARMLGYDAREEILAHHAVELYLDPADRVALVQRLHAEGQVSNFELLLRRRDGSPVWVLENVTLLPDNDAGPVLEGTIVDISAQKHTEEALRASEAKYRTVVENLDQSIFLKDANLRFVAANPSFCHNLGVGEAELVGRTDLDFYPRHLAEKYRADDLIVLAEGRHLSLEEENVQGSRTHTVRVVKTPVKDDRGRIMGVLGIFWDVTEQRALEAQLRQSQKMEAIGQLAGGVAHDFNNLLTVMLGNISLLLPRVGTTEPERELLLTAEQAALRAAELTRRLLGFSRRTMLRVEPINLNHCIEETVRILRRTIDPRVRVEVKARPDLWTVKADSAQVNQVLMNLCLNARDAMPEGGHLALETEHFVPDEEYLRMHLEARPGEFVRLRVRDTGHGIPADVRPRIFDPFFTTKEVGKGTGLGLAMVFGIIKQHRGWIDCESAVNAGTAFDIYLPHHALQEAAVSPIPALARPATPGKETILLVDDEPMIRQLGRMILERHGYRVLLAGDGIEALEVYRENRGKIDLVILDLTMPRLSGRDTLKRLVEMDPEIRVLFSSGYSAEHMATSEFRQVLGFINKPYRADELATKLRDSLDQRPTES